jgi:hypothetical protein
MKMTRSVTRSRGRPADGITLIMRELPHIRIWRDAIFLSRVVVHLTGAPMRADELERAKCKAAIRSTT